MNYKGWTLLPVLTLIGCVIICQSARILLVPFPFGSHVLQLRQIGEALIVSGHEADIILPETFPSLDMFQKSKIKVVLYKSIDTDTYQLLNEQILDDSIEQSINTNILNDFRDYTTAEQLGFTAFCTNPLKDKDALQTLNSKEYDLAVLDAFQMNRCLAILVYKLDLPIVSVITLYEPWLLRNPALPSFVPSVLVQPPMSTVMTFTERLTNLWLQIDWAVSPRCPYINDDWVREFVPEKPPLTINDILRQSLLWLIDSDVVIDYPRPLMANEVMIGGVTAKPAQPLSEDLERFLLAAKDGVIVVSFGSSDANLPVIIREKLIAALNKTGMHVIWRYPHSIPDDLPDKMKLLKWMPQNDILAHPNVKLFITHCGANGQFESLYNGVPMLGMPMFGDQMYNAVRMTYHGYGEWVNLRHLTTHELYDKIHIILHDTSYATNIKLASKIFKDRPLNAIETTIYWVNHVLQYGGDHLHSYALDMPWYQYLMLDIALFVLTVIILLVIGIIYVTKLAWKYVVEKQNKEKTN